MSDNFNWTTYRNLLLNWIVSRKRFSDRQRSWRQTLTLIIEQQNNPIWNLHPNFSAIPKGECQLSAVHRLCASQTSCLKFSQEIRAARLSDTQMNNLKGGTAPELVHIIKWSLACKLILVQRNFSIKIWMGKT